MAISSRSLPDNRLIQRFGLKLPVIQAPMAGVSTPEMAAAVSNAGGLGSIALGAADLEATHAMLSQTRALTERPFNANLFCHAPARPDPAREAAWLSRLTPEFARFNASPPSKLQEIYPSARTNTPLLELLLAAPPAVISLHFGLLPPDWIARLKSAGSYLIASATNLDEARACARAGIDAVVAQGWEAGGHRGVFDPHGSDAELSTAALLQLLRQKIDLPVIAAGGIMDAPGIQAARDLGAACAQMGTAFIACHESLADDGYRAALASDAAQNTVMTRAISGRPARALANDFTALGADIPASEIPDYPIAYDAGKALNSAAKAQGAAGYGAQWAGQGAPLAQCGRSAGDLIAKWEKDLRA